jgi:hypothetical protein
MYKAFSNDYSSATITRLGDTNVTLTIPSTAFTYTGTATPSVDFAPATNLTFNAGDVTHIAQIFPLSNGVPPIDVADPQYVGNKSGTITLTAASGYGVGAASTPFSIIDNAYAPTSSLILSDSLTTTNDSTNWTITFGSTGQTVDPNDYNVNFGYDLTANNPNAGNNGVVGFPPSGATTALRINCCQNLQAEPEWQGGVNVYFTNTFLSGNYAVRFYMNNVQGYGVPVNENVEGGPLIGINHNGKETNWWEGTGDIPSGGLPYTGTWSMDGIWHWIDASPGSYQGSDYEQWVGNGSPLTNTGSIEVNASNYTSFENVYKDPAVYTTFLAGTKTSVGGDPANASSLATQVPAAAENDWADVELKQVNGVVTLSINHNPIFVYTNTTMFTNGYLMLGYCSPFMGIYGQAYNSPDQACYFSDLSVVELGPDIVIPPANLTVGAGSNATFSVTTGYSSSAVTNQLETASGTPVGSPVIVSAPGGLATLTIPGVTSGSNGNYMVVVSDTSGYATSIVASLTVIAPPEVSTPASITNNVGATVSFTAAVAGTGPFTYQWYSNGVALTSGGIVSGATSTNILTLTGITLSDAASYSLMASNFAGTNRSAPATLTVVVPTSPDISGSGISGGKEVISFTGDPYDTTNSFNLQESTNLANPSNAGFVDINAAWTVSAGVFTVQLPTNNAVNAFYRIQHK